jgi:hypothetical protein
VLNTAQMRDAIHVQHFRISSETLDVDDIVHESVVKELAALKALGTIATGASKRSGSKAARTTGPTASGLSAEGRARPQQISQLIANS